MQKDPTSLSVTSQSTLCSTLYVPVAHRQRPQLTMDQKYPFNSEYVNLNPEVLKIVCEHFHEHPSYTDAEGHQKAREYLAERFGVKSSDVFLAPTNAQAYWYIVNLFLDDGDAVASTPGLKADLLKVKTDTDYKVLDLSEMEAAKLVMGRIPDVDSDSHSQQLVDLFVNLRQLEETFKTPKAFAVEEPFALLQSARFGFSVRGMQLPERTPVYLLTSLDDILLSDACGFSVIVLLNNPDGRFDKLAKGLSSIADFYNPPNTAFHPLIGQILPAIDSNIAYQNFEALESRKVKVAQMFIQKGLETHIPPKHVFSVGVKKTSALVGLVERGELSLSSTEKYRHDNPFIYLSILYGDSAFLNLLERL
jgi:hypothetical protein